MSTTKVSGTSRDLTSPLTGARDRFTRHVQAVECAGDGARAVLNDSAANLKMNVTQSLRAKSALSVTRTRQHLRCRRASAAAAQDAGDMPAAAADMHLGG
jgi:hypothetical protein